MPLQETGTHDARRGSLTMTRHRMLEIIVVCQSGLVLLAPEPGIRCCSSGALAFQLVARLPVRTLARHGAIGSNATPVTGQVKPNVMTVPALTLRTLGT